MGSEMCIRDRTRVSQPASFASPYVDHLLPLIVTGTVSGDDNMELSVQRR